MFLNVLQDPSAAECYNIKRETECFNINALKQNTGHTDFKSVGMWCIKFKFPVSFSLSVSSYGT